MQYNNNDNSLEEFDITKKHQEIFVENYDLSQVFKWMLV